MSRRSAHYSVATSGFFADTIAESLRVPRQRVLVAGLPRNAWLLEPDSMHAAVKEDRNKIAVWLPTYRSGEADGYVLKDSTDGPDPASEENLAILDDKLDDADLLLVLKLHPLDLKNRKQWPEYRNIRIVRHVDFQGKGLNIYKLLGCADALITDFSSIAVDYLSVNKPIGVFAPDRASYTRGFVTGSMERLESVCSRLDSVDELAAFLCNLPGPRQHSAELNDLYQQNLHTPSQDILRAVGLKSLAE